MQQFSASKILSRSKKFSIIIFLEYMKEFSWKFATGDIKKLKNVGQQD